LLACHRAQIHAQQADAYDHVLIMTPPTF
jgi:hypothetical protein